MGERTSVGVSAALNVARLLTLFGMFGPVAGAGAKRKNNNQQSALHVLGGEESDHGREEQRH